MMELVKEVKNNKIYSEKAQQKQTLTEQIEAYFEIIPILQSTIV